MDYYDVHLPMLRRRDKRFVWIARRLDAAAARAVRQADLPGVGLLQEWQREYPHGTLAATVIGFRRTDGVAGGGLEAALDEHLHAEDGRRVALADARRRAVWPLADQSRPPHDGANVFLTIDVVIQRALAEAVGEAVRHHRAKWGTGVVVNPHTGEVLAMCSVPTFDPNAYRRTTPAQRTNRAISTPYEPGSVAKPLFAAAAVNAGLLRWDSRIFCENGLYRTRGGGVIRDHHSYGRLSLTDVVVKSSNVGMAKVGERLGNGRLHAVARRFGLGQRTGVGLGGESPGILRPRDDWDGYSTRRVPFGQEVSVTALQLTMAFASLVNGGELLRPRLVDRVVAADGTVVHRGRREVVRRTLRPDVSAAMLDVLRQVVERGTGKRCRLSRWTSFGKTGTAQIAGRGGYVDGAYTASFVGGAPAGRPELLCTISIYWPREHGYYGGTVAAPRVRRVLEQALAYRGVPPDRTEVASGQLPVARRQR